MSSPPSTSTKSKSTCLRMFAEFADGSTFDVDKNFSDFCELFRIHKAERRKAGLSEQVWNWKVDEPDVKKVHLERICRFLHLFDANHPHPHFVKDTTVIRGLPPLPEGVPDTRPPFFVRDATGKNFNDRSEDGPYDYKYIDKIAYLPEWAKEFFDELELDDLYATNYTAHYLGATIYNKHSNKYLMLHYMANLSTSEPFDYRAPKGGGKKRTEQGD